MARLTFDRLTDEIGTQTGLLAEAVGGADLATPVHTCPGWTVRDVARHVGGGHRWVAEILRTRATEPVDDGGLRDLAAYPDDDPATVAAWLRDGAAQLTGALRDAGPDLDVWTPVPGRRERASTPAASPTRISSTAPTPSWLWGGRSPLRRTWWSTRSTSGWSWARCR